MLRDRLMEKERYPVNFANDLHPEISDYWEANGIGIGYYWIAYKAGGETIKVEYRALSLNEAIGAFLVEYSNMSFEDILDCFEV